MNKLPLLPTTSQADYVNPDIRPRMITCGLANINVGLEDCIFIGNIDALRDWSHAKDYVRMQWLMLQQEQAEGFVIATGVQYTVRQFIEKTATALGMQLRGEGADVNEVGYNQSIIRIDPRYFHTTKGGHCQVQH